MRWTDIRVEPAERLPARASRPTCDALDLPDDAPLYKFLPSKYVKTVLEDGVFLFRNLSYFRKLEEAHRGDVKEGVHRDHPDHPVTMEIVTTGKKIVGDFAFLNSIAWDHCFAYCFTTEFNRKRCSAALVERGVNTG
jgi:hypothetical protein